MIWYQRVACLLDDLNRLNRESHIHFLVQPYTSPDFEEYTQFKKYTLLNDEEYERYLHENPQELENQIFLLEIVDRLKEFDPKKSIPSPLWDGIELENLKDICQLFCASQGISLESDEMEACMIGMIHNYFEQDDDLCVQMIRNYWMDKRPWRDDR